MNKKFRKVLYVAKSITKVFCSNHKASILETFFASSLALKKKFTCIVVCLKYTIKEKACFSQRKESIV